MISSEHTYAAPKVQVLEVISEMILCQSSLEGLDENPGTWDYKAIEL